MRKFSTVLIISLLAAGCSALGIRSDRMDELAEKVRNRACRMDETARQIIRREFAMQGIEIKVDCNFKGTED